ncbi:MAG: hypothetical protein IJA34_13885 [Lachnospiraceae bacterium]|nr:hypothetical protein [Lachnospiraceae bacterium]
MSDVQMEYNNAFDDSKELFTPEMENGNWLSSKHAQLSGTQKKGIFGNVKKDSSTFNNIKNTLSTLNGLLEKKMSGDNYDNQTTLQMAYNAYMALIQLCDNYLLDKKGGVRTARTDTGKSRIKMVNEIKQFAEKDINAVRVQMYLPDNLKGTTLKEAIGKARMREINLTKDESEYKHVGGLASNLLVIPKDSEGTANEFFSDLKIVDRNNEYSNILGYVEKAFKRSKINSESKSKVLKAILDSGKTDKKSIDRIVNADRNKYEYSNDPEAVKFAMEITKITMDAGSIQATYENAFMKNLLDIKSDRVNMNARNVATSRIAELFGRGDLIAKSEMAVVKEYGNGVERVGSVMEGVGGKEAITTLREDLVKCCEENGRFVKVDEFKNKVVGLIKGDFQRDLSDLQVLDFLCGQIDRHFKNYFVQKDSDGNYAGVKGIDNDLSFGNAKEKKDKYIYGPHGRTVVNSNAELIIPHMSLELAIRVNMINESMVKYALMDLIAKPEIEAFCERLNLLKMAIRKEFEKAPEESKLVSKGKWDSNTLKDFITGLSEKKDKNLDDGTANYVGRFVEEFAGLSGAYHKNEELNKWKQKS